MKKAALIKIWRLLEICMKNNHILCLTAILGVLLVGGSFYLVAIQPGLNSALPSGQTDDRTRVILGLLVAGVGLWLLGLYALWQTRQLMGQYREMEKTNTLLKRRVSQVTVELAQTVKQLSQETEQRRLLAIQLKEQTTTDPLTGLLTRGTGMALLVNHLHMSERFQWVLTVWAVNIDNLKQVKDKFGYEAGDQMTKGISRIICENIRESDTVFRMGDDELMVILPKCSISEAGTIRDRTIESCRRDAQINQHEWQAVISDGFAEYQPGCRTKVAVLIQQASLNARNKTPAKVGT
jgi:diguanylate cyclase (GGDEF)-like protein